MRKSFWKNQARTLCLGLLIANTPVFAGYSDDPDCKAVSDSAKNSATQAKARVDTVAQNTAQAINTSKACVDQVLQGVNRAIPSFGGSVDVVTSQLSQVAANRACQMITDAQNTATQAATTQVNNAVNNAVSSIPVTPAVVNQVVAPTTSNLYQRLSNLF